MTLTADATRAARAAHGTVAGSGRYRLNRAGILNVWQYDEQEFDFADGRLLLRGANGAGKSKTLEMLLPFVLDGDKARMTASARHHTSLLWLMTDGYDGQARVGYLWVEFARRDDDGNELFFTCGAGIRASVSSRAATAWFFTTPLRVGRDLELDDGAGPLTRARLVETLGDRGQVFEHARAYKEHVGRALFGLEVERYDEVLQLLYWLRQPQVGEDIEPNRLAGQLLQALPQLDEGTVRAAGDTFDELVAVGEQIQRRTEAVEALTALSDAYMGYATTVAAERAATFLSAHQDQARRRTERRHAEDRHAELQRDRDALETEVHRAERELDENRARLQQLQESPEARSQQQLTQLSERTAELRRAADDTRRAFDRAQERLNARAARLESDLDDLSGRLHAHVEDARVLDRELDRLRVDAPLGSALFAATLTTDDLDRVQRLESQLADHLELLEQARQAVRGRQTVVTVVRRALDEQTDAEARSRHQDERASEAEQRWEVAVSAADAARRTVDDLLAQLRHDLDRWAAMPDRPRVDLPEALSPDTVRALGPAATAAATPVLTELGEHARRRVGDRSRAAEEVETLLGRRAEIEAETDPAPPPPPVERTPRPDGAPLWRLLDFRPEVTPEGRAGVEAALQASGILDAWVRPDGRLLDVAHLDTVLDGRSADGADENRRTLAEVLVPDVPAGSDVVASVMTSVLGRLLLVDSVVGVDGSSSVEHSGHPGAAEPRTAAVVGLDGSWASGPLHGRARKERAQYIGATARAEERRRRLAAVTTELEAARGRHAAAVAELEALDTQIAAVEAWVRDLPAVEPALSAWVTLDERAAVAAREEAAHREAHDTAQELRRHAARAREELNRLAEQHRTPAEGEPLAALAEQLGAALYRLDRSGATVPPLRRDLARWLDEHQEATAERRDAEALGEDADRATARADDSAARLQELQAAVGSDVAALQRRLERLRDALRAAGERRTEVSEGLRRVDTEVGKAEEAVSTATDRLAETEQALTVAVAGFAELVDVPGLLLAATVDAASVDLQPLRIAGRSEASDPLPNGLVTVARSLRGHRETASAAVTDMANHVYKAHNDASTGPAADHETRLLTVDGLLAVVGRDEGGEHPVTELAARTRSAVERDRMLLTERERTQFERHVLGELGDAIRRRRLEAEELVTAMNGLLGEVSTSQGIRVRLDWRMRSDVPPEAAQAVRLLTQPIGALLPEERTALHDSLHRLIDASRAEHPELSYAEHLASALDYRRWFAFTIRYTRPESVGRWLDLHRRSALSQGEQKVVCYLPLFAAAAAHFTSLAGAAPHAPRLILLDDAFPKIDVRTHPLLFGLLVQLDLDFVVTSERLWGDHDTLPSLAIYEALRDPGQRGIAQFEFRWDGRTLRATQ